MKCKTRIKLFSARKRNLLLCKNLLFNKPGFTCIKHLVFCFTCALHLSGSNACCQLIPDFEMPIKIVTPEGEDSVIIGLSQKAGKGYNEDLDVIDTDELKLPVDLRIFDTLSVEQLGDPCKHYSTKYLSIPSKNTDQIEKFERNFILVARMDLEKIDNSGQGIFCDDPRNGTTFLQVDLDPMTNYQYINDVGYNIEEIEIVPSGNAYLSGIDGSYWEGFVPEKYCVTILAYDFQALPDCNIDLTFEVKFIINNSLYIHINELQQHNIQITQANNQVMINNPSSFKFIELFDLTGKLLFRQMLDDRQITIDMHTHNNQIYWLRFSQPGNNDYLIHKFFKL